MKTNIMPVPFTISLSRPIASVKIIENNTVSSARDLSLGRSGAEPDSYEQIDAKKISLKELGSQKITFLEACRVLNCVTAKINQFCEQLFCKQKEEIARLSVEIARKILVKKIENRDYEIESIVQEALNNAPSRQDVIVHLNPEDLAYCQKAQQDEPGGIFSGIKFTPDPKIGRAECLLESPNGIIESLINEQLNKISKALIKV